LNLDRPNSQKVSPYSHYLYRVLTLESHKAMTKILLIVT
jgi:hypothetical protein